MNQHRFYSDLARFWPLISPVEEYEEEANYAISQLKKAERPVRQVLELGSGGGHNARYLREHFEMTLVDLSPDMLAQSMRLNPGCEHLVGDMREVRLGRDFDAVFIHDAIDYMTTLDDLERAVATAHAHCRPGGICVITPDETAESFAPDTGSCGSDGPDGSGARCFEWTWDPDPSDTWRQTEYSLVCRDASGAITAAHESHRTGLFSIEAWLGALRRAGFVAERVVEETSEPREPRSIFLGRRPLAGGRAGQASR